MKKIIYRHPSTHVMLPKPWIIDVPDPVQVSAPDPVEPPKPVQQADSNVQHFDSIAEFCSQPFQNSGNRANCANSIGTDHGSWHYSGGDATRWLGASTARQAAQRVTQGWPEGADRALNLLASLDVPPPMDTKRRVTRSDQGDELDIHAVYKGQLDTAWSRRKRKQGRGPFIVRLVAQCNLLSSFTPEEMFWRGAAIIKAVEMLTTAGYSVEVLGVTASHSVGGIGDFCHTYPLKESKSPLDVAGLAGVVCNAGFHRLYGFRAYSAAAERKHSTGDASSDTSGRIYDKYVKHEDGVPTFRVPYSTSTKRAVEAWLTELVTELETGERQPEGEPQLFA